MKKCTCGGNLPCPYDAPSSPVETTAGTEQRPDHTGVIRGADEREARWVGLAYDVCRAAGSMANSWPEIAAPLMAVADAEHTALTAEVADWRAAQQRLWMECDNTVTALGFLEVEVAEQIAKVAARDATIERLTYDRNHPYGEVANEPDVPTTNLLPVAPRLVVGHGAVGNTPMCLVHPEHFMPCSRCLGYGCTACDRGVQAADDRRSL